MGLFKMFKLFKKKQIDPLRKKELLLQLNKSARFFDSHVDFIRINEALKMLETLDELQRGGEPLAAISFTGEEGVIVDTASYEKVKHI